MGHNFQSRVGSYYDGGRLMLYIDPEPGKERSGRAHLPADYVMVRASDKRVIIAPPAQSPRTVLTRGEAAMVRQLSLISDLSGVDLVIDEAS